MIVIISQCFGLVAAIMAAALGAVRLIESIYQLRKKPELDTLGKVIQVVKNFFTLETYNNKEA